MNDIQPFDQSEIEIKIKEAETCYSMGMKQEAVTLYEQVLKGLPRKNGQILETMRLKIDRLKKEISN